MGGAVFGTDAEGGTVGALAVVHHRNIADDPDGAGGTDLFTFFAADAADGAHLSGQGALVLIAAGIDYPASSGECLGDGIEGAHTKTGRHIDHGIPGKGGNSWNLRFGKTLVNGS